MADSTLGLRSEEQSVWLDILKVRRGQREDERRQQLALFELKEDRRPASQSSADGRYSEPTLFKID